VAGQRLAAFAKYKAIGRKGGMMKTEDRYLLVVVGFIIGWITLMGMGVLG